MTLASALSEATRALRMAEAKIDVLLNLLLGERGWSVWKFFQSYDNRYAIDVFDAEPNKAVARQLFAAGFTTVCLHPHKPGKLLTCTCSPLEAY